MDEQVSREIFTLLFLLYFVAFYFDKNKIPSNTLECARKNKKNTVKVFHIDRNKGVSHSD